MTNRLPGNVDELRGLRAARWIRESSGRQLDKFGPEAQRKRHDDAIEEFHLVDTGLAWTLAASGWSGPDSMDDPPATRTPEFQGMLAAAEAGLYDVLLVGYTSRSIRDLSTALVTRRRLHRAGVAMWIVDDRILTSDPIDWERFVDKSKAAEVYSADLSKNIRSGYQAKLASERDPGGRPGFGFRRSADDSKVLEPDPALIATVVRIYELAAARLTDREVASQTGLTIHVVRSTLRSTLYAGRLPDGRETRFPSIVPPALWNDVQAARERRRTRDGRPAVRRHYALSMLRCAGCDRRLTGDTGRYRHDEACPAFLAAAVTPKRRRRGQHAAVPGRSYDAAVYERLIAEVLADVALGADVLTDVLADPDRHVEPDRVGLARIERERDQAMTRYRRTRDAAELERTMARLDTEADLASTVDLVEPLPAAEAIAYLRNLPTLWADAPRSRRALAEALFDRVDVLGLRTMRIAPTAAAVDRGLADAFHARTAGYGRGERSDGRGSHLIVRAVPGIATRITLVVPPRLLAPVRSARSA